MIFCSFIQTLLFLVLVLPDFLFFYWLCTEIFFFLNNCALRFGVYYSLKFFGH